MNALVEEYYKKLVMVKSLRKTYPDSFFLDPEFDIEIEGVDPKNESILYDGIGVIYMAMHLMKAEYGYEGKVYNHDEMDNTVEDEWAAYYEEIQEQILHIFHRHDGEQDQWDGKVAPTLFYDLEYEDGLSLSKQNGTNEALKDRAIEFAEIFENN